MKLGISTSGDVETTVARCKRFGTNCVSIAVMHLPGYEEKGYPDPAALRKLKETLEEQGLEVRDVSWRLLKWPRRPYRTHSRGGVTSPDVLLSRDRPCIDAMARMIEVVGGRPASPRCSRSSTSASRLTPRRRRPAGAG